MIVVPNAVEITTLQLLFSNLHKLRLFENNIIPDETDTLASFVEVIPGASGYAELDLHSANWDLTPGSPSVALYNSIQQWLFTGTTGGTGFVYGYYVVDSVTNLLRYSERFTSSFTPVNGARIRFTPRFECA